jgi:hypothetical protein
MFFRKRISVSSLVELVWKEFHHALVTQLEMSGITDSKEIPDFDKMAIARTVDSVIADSGILTGLVRRLVIRGPKLSIEAVLSHGVIGLQRCYAHVGKTREEAERRATKAAEVAEACFAEPRPQSVAELWQRIFHSVLPEYTIVGAHYSFFAALVVEQNKLLVPILDKCVGDYKVRLI